MEPNVMTNLVGNIYNIIDCNLCYLVTYLQTTLMGMGTGNGGLLFSGIYFLFMQRI